MDLDEFRSILSNSKANIWEIIDAAITLASTDYPRELKHRRDAIVQRLYTPPLLQQPKITVDNGGGESPLTPQSVPQDDDDDNGNDDGDNEEEADPYGGLFDDEQTKILTIKQQLEDPHQVLFYFVYLDV